MPIDPQDIESQAKQSQHVGDFEGAARLWSALVEIEPRWEHGYPYYFLADCYTRMGQFDKADMAYRKAIEIAPEDELFSTGLQSFLEARKSGVLQQAVEKLMASPKKPR